MNKCINTINYEKGQMNGVMGGGITLFHPFDPPGPVIPPGSAVTTLLTMDYCGNHIYRNGSLERTMNGYGYQADSTYYYYIKDYQGNVRAVIDQSGALKEINNYYPYGGLMGGAVTGIQPDKYGGKELDRENGIDWYDSQARMLDPMIGRTTTMDPMAEKYYSNSPYVWCANNPIRYSDYDGSEIYINNDEELRLIQNIVSKEERQFISMMPNGHIDMNLLSEGFSELPNVSRNFEILSSLVQADAIVEFSLSTQKVARLENGSYANPNNIPFPFNDIIPPDEFDNEYSLQGAIGWTLAPLSHQWTRNDAIIRNERSPENRFISTSENYQVQINAYGLKQKSTYIQLVETAAHELLGHAYLMIFGFDSLHGSSKSVNYFIIDISNEAIRHFNNGN